MCARHNLLAPQGPCGRSKGAKELIMLPLTQWSCGMNMCMCACPYPGGARQAVADVGSNAVGEQGGLLRHHTQLRSEPLRIQLPDIHPIRQHLHACEHLSARSLA